MLHYEVSVYVITGEHPSLEPLRDLQDLNYFHDCEDSFRKCMEDMGFDHDDPSYYWMESTSWHDWYEDFAQLSEDFPELLIRVYTEEECDGERMLSYNYFIAGKAQHCPAVITFAPFNLSEMENV